MQHASWLQNEQQESSISNHGIFISFHQNRLHLSHYHTQKKKRSKSQCLLQTTHIPGKEKQSVHLWHSLNASSAGNSSQKEQCHLPGYLWHQ